LFGIAPGGACHAGAVTSPPVGSYPTVSPLPLHAAAVCSLWRFPWGCPRRALPGTVASWSPDFPRQLPAAVIRPSAQGGYGGKQGRGQWGDGSGGALPCRAGARPPGIFVHQRWGGSFDDGGQRGGGAAVGRGFGALRPGAVVQAKGGEAGFGIGGGITDR